MKKKLLKLLALAFSVVTLSACGVACSDGDLGNSSSSSTTSVENSSTTESADGTVNAIFTLNGGTITGLTAYGKTLSKITIPSKIDGVSVTSIGDSAFYNHSSLTSIEIPDSVKSIGNSAFEYCSFLTSVTIGNGVTSIGHNAFYSCISLTSIKIPDSVTSIGIFAFDDCYYLTSVTIGNGVTSIGYYAFEDCSRLTSIEVGTNNTAYTSIDGNLYSKDGKTLVQYAMGKTATSFVIPDSVESIGSYAFEDCDSLTSIEIPDSVTSIGYQAFEDCSNLTLVVIGDGVESIGENAFSDCSNVRLVVIGDGVKSISRYAFDACSNLLAVRYKGTASEWESIDIDSRGNSYLTNATRYYYVENEADVPTDGGNYWHYVDGEPRLW